MGIHHATPPGLRLPAQASHPLRTPLHGVIAALGLVRREALDPESLAALEMALRSAETLARTLDEMLGEAPPPRPAAPAAPRRARVLVVDDVAANRELAAAHLRRAGHEVVLADGGAAALALFGAQGCDLVLMDVMMPEMDGMEATRALRALPGGQVPVLGLTAAATGDLRATCLAAGMDEVLPKPIGGAALIGVVAEWLARAEAGQA
jgi:CheY-like chemotaxis protein